MLKQKQEPGLSSSEFLDRITEFLTDTSYMTTQELKEHLETKGVDTDAALKRVYALLEKYDIKPRKG